MNSSPFEAKILLSSILLGLGDNKALIWVEGDAESLKFEDNSMDGYTIAFGIRNVTHIEKVLAEAYRYEFPDIYVVPRCQHNKNEVQGSRFRLRSLI